MTAFSLSHLLCFLCAVCCCALRAPDQIVASDTTVTSISPYFLNTHFGAAVALASDRDRLFVSEIQRNATRGGIIYFYDKEYTFTGNETLNITSYNATWVLKGTFGPGNGWMDFAGMSIATNRNGTVVVVGAPQYQAGGNTVYGNSGGGAYVFVATSDVTYGLASGQPLTAPTNEYANFCGNTVKISQDGSAVFMGCSGSAKEAPLNGGSRANQGVWVFRRTGPTTWTRAPTIVSTGDTVIGGHDGQRFGINEDGTVLALRGWPDYRKHNVKFFFWNGASYVAGVTYAPVFPMPDPSKVEARWFGSTILISSDDNEAFINSPQGVGQLHVFDTNFVNATTKSVAWTQTITPEVKMQMGGDSNLFGTSMAKEGRLLVVGAPVDPGWRDGHGFAGIYRKLEGESSWTMAEELATGHDPPAFFQPPGYGGPSYDASKGRGLSADMYYDTRMRLDDMFGCAVAINNRTVVVGARMNGAVYIYNNLDEYLLPPQPSASPRPSQTPIVFPSQKPPKIDDTSVTVIEVTRAPIEPKKPILEISIGVGILLLLLIIAFILARCLFKRRLRKKLGAKQKADALAHSRDFIGDPDHSVSLVVGPPRVKKNSMAPDDYL